MDDTLQKSVEAAKAKCLLKFHQAAKDISQVEQSAAEFAVDAQSAAESQSLIVFNACVKQLQELYSSCQKVPRLTQLQPGYCALVGTDTSGPHSLSEHWVCAARRPAGVWGVLASYVAAVVHALDHAARQ